MKRRRDRVSRRDGGREERREEMKEGSKEQEKEGGKEGRKEEDMNLEKQHNEHVGIARGGNRSIDYHMSLYTLKKF